MKGDFVNGGERWYREEREREREFTFERSEDTVKRKKKESGGERVETGVMQGTMGKWVFVWSSLPRVARYWHVTLII